MGIAIAILMTLAPIGFGRIIVTRLSAEMSLTTVESCIFATTLGNAILAFTAWGVGTASYTRLSMLSILAAFFAVSILGGVRMLGRIVFIRPSNTNRIQIALMSMIALIMALGYLGCLAPPADHDSLRYHLRLPERNLMLGRIAAIHGWSVYEFLPPLGQSLNHIAYALGGPTATNALNVTWQLLAGVATYALARRLGLHRTFALVACLLLISQRISLHLSSVASVDFFLTSYCAVSLLAAVILYRKPSSATALLTGLACGSAANVKHSGLIFVACLIIWLAYRSVRGASLRPMVAVVAAVVAVAVLPWLWRNTVITGNPFFPAFHHLFDTANLDIFARFLANQVSFMKAPFTFLLAPLHVFTNPQIFGGHHFGIPILLLFLPFAAIGLAKEWRSFATIIIASYFVVWLMVMPHRVRFLLPIFPVLCAVAACGAETVFAAAVRAGAPHRRAVAGIALVLILGQMAFAGATAIRRIPAAFNIVDPLSYLESNPFAFYAQFRACAWIKRNLPAASRYLALMSPPSWHCPLGSEFPQLLPGDAKQMYTRKGRRPVPGEWLASRIHDCRIAYVVVSDAASTYQQNDNEPLAFAKHRYDDVILPALAHLKPVFLSQFAKIYAGADIAAFLLANPKRIPRVPEFVPPNGDICDLRSMDAAIREAQR